MKKLFVLVLTLLMIGSASFADAIDINPSYFGNDSVADFIRACVNVGFIIAPIVAIIIAIIHYHKKDIKNQPEKKKKFYVVTAIILLILIGLCVLNFWQFPIYYPIDSGNGPFDEAKTI